MPNTQSQDASVKTEEVPAPEPEPTPVVEVIIRPLHDIGHTINLAAKVAQPDGSVVDHVVESNGPAKELRLELTHLQEAVIRAKVVNLVKYDAAQSAVISVPPEDIPAGFIPKPKKGQEESHPEHQESHRKTQTQPAAHR